jgi:AcrR family transcriptional regulator
VSKRSPNSTQAPPRRKRGRPPSPESRDRILTAGLRLFAEQGFAETSVGQVQAAAGLSSGSGALYKHFSSKEELLEAGIERELVHLEAVRIARRLIPDLGDFEAELEIIGRFILLELGAESDLLRILLKDGDRFPKLLADARRRLIDPAYAEFADWLREHVDAGKVCVDDLEGTAAVALGAIVQYRAIEGLLGQPPGGLDEERFLQSWVSLVNSLTRNAR